MSRPEDPVITIEGFHKGETAKAICFEIWKINDENCAEQKTEWIPFSQIKKTVRQPKNSQEMDLLVVSQWIMKAKDLI